VINLYGHIFTEKEAERARESDVMIMNWSIVTKVTPKSREKLMFPLAEMIRTGW